MYNLLEILLGNMDSVFIIMQMISNCTTTSHNSSPSLAMTINRLQNCVADLQVWFKKNQMIKNNVKMNLLHLFKSDMNIW